MKPAGTRAIAVIPAAGSGSRMGGALPKQYLMLHGRPMLWHSAQMLLTHPAIDEVVIVVDAGDAYWEQLGLHESLAPCTLLRLGGETRAHTVRNALHALQTRVSPRDWILVHDAARPCLDRAALDRLLRVMQTDDVGGLLAIPVRDTLKRARADGRVDATQPREGLWQAQTPQMFRHCVLLQALERTGLDGITDEASAVERLGLHPLLVQGSVRNIKVTYPEDVALAQEYLRT